MSSPNIREYAGPFSVYAVHYDDDSSKLVVVDERALEVFQAENDDSSNIELVEDGFPSYDEAKQALDFC